MVSVWSEEIGQLQSLSLSLSLSFFQEVDSLSQETDSLSQEVDSLSQEVEKEDTSSAVQGREGPDGEEGEESGTPPQPPPSPEFVTSGEVSGVFSMCVSSPL